MMNNKDQWHDQDIAHALAAFQPQPSERFFQKMQRQPWMAQPMTTPTHAASKRTSNRRWIPVMAMLARLLVVGTVLVTPPLRALAQEMLEWVVRVPSDTMTNRELAAVAPPPSLEDLRHGLSQTEAEQLAGFQLWKPSVVPEEHHFAQAFYLPAEQTVAASYVAGDYPMVDPRIPSGFGLMQQPAARAASSTSVFPIGASAAIETVQIGDVAGQYVEGAWCGANSDPETPMQWCGGSSARALRWQRGEWVFTLSAHDVGGGYIPSITREQMIELAANLVPPEE